MRRAGPLWVLIVGVYAAFAVGSVVVLVRHSASARAASTAPVAGARPVVLMADIAYKPTQLTVAPGTEVRFDNKDVAPHTITETGGGIDSGIIDPGRSFMLVVRQPLSYFCVVHPNMKAKIAVST
jgi:plastocyanin